MRLALLEVPPADVRVQDVDAAAEELGLPPGECFVVEDAANGVQAAKAGNMVALGLARADDEELLAAANADLVVTTLDDISLDALYEGRLEQGSIR